MHTKPKKSLGQNFLVDQNIQRKIISACNLNPKDTVLEIGAGRGELTLTIAKEVPYVLALELDSCLLASLEENLKGYPNVKIINQDILKFNLKKYFNKIEKKIKVVGNIPYYITTPIVEHLIRMRDKIDTVFITVQKEFAQRMTAHPGSKEFGSFSCFVQYYTDPKILFVIKKTCFLPQPKVDSCLVKLKMRSEPPVKPRNEKLFFKVVRSSFNQRRKTIRNSLKGLVKTEKISLFFNASGLDPNTRPEDMSLEDFTRLVNL